MGYKMKGFSGFGNSPAKQKKDLKPYKFGDDAGQADVDLTKKTGLGPRADAKPTKKSKEDLPEFLEEIGEKLSAAPKKEVIIHIGKEPESYGAGHKKVMKSGTKNKTVGAGDTGDWQAHQFKQ